MRATGWKTENVGHLSCLELRANSKTVFGADNTSCAIAEANFRLHRTGMQALLDQVSREVDVAAIHLDEFFVMKAHVLWN